MMMGGAKLQFVPLHTLCFAQGKPLTCWSLSMVVVKSPCNGAQSQCKNGTELQMKIVQKWAMKRLWEIIITFSMDIITARSAINTAALVLYIIFYGLIYFNVDIYFWHSINQPVDIMCQIKCYLWIQ